MFSTCKGSTIVAKEERREENKRKVCYYDHHCCVYLLYVKNEERIGEKVRQCGKLMELMANERQKWVKYFEIGKKNAERSKKREKQFFSIVGHTRA